MKLLRSVLLAALVGILALPLQAQTTVFSGVYTGGTGFTTTAAISLTYLDEGGGMYLYQLNVTNQGVYGEVYASVALFNIPDAVAFSYVSAPAGWSPPPPDPLSNLEPVVAGYEAPKPWPGNGLKLSQSGTFKFRLSNFTDLAQLRQIGAGVHAISGPNECSGKLAVKNGVVMETSWDSSCGPPPTVVPEPSTVILLGTGIAGILGFGYVRRRREEEEVS